MSKLKTKGINSSLKSISKKAGTKSTPFLFVWTLVLLFPLLMSGQNEERHLYIDVHDIGAGNVTFADVAAAHEKDLVVQDKHNVKFVKFWVNEEAGKVYCLSEAPNAHSIYSTHKEAHGLLPSHILEVSNGEEAALAGGQLYLDIHELAPGSVTPEMVAGAHEKDLAVEGKYGVHFINYFIDEKEGVVMCLSEAPNPEAIINTHKEAHGLLPSKVIKVQEGE